MKARGAGMGDNTTKAMHNTTVQRNGVREPAVAGLFYPAEPDRLERMVDEFLAAARVPQLPRLRALICPHAGYIYSGLTAAHGYKCLAGRAPEKVFVLAPSHYAYFEGVSVPLASAYRTPLGLCEIAEEARELMQQRPCRPEPVCRVQRPGWWMATGKRPPPPGRETPDTWEHAVEVQVPFLQKVLSRFALLPLVYGRVAPEAVADVLERHLGDHTLLVVSSDLSHYHPYETARRMDLRCIQAICALDAGAVQHEEACGQVPILTLLHLARRHGWQARLLDYRNSGDTAGDKSGVVGYAAIAFYEPATPRFSATERAQLLALARRTLTEVVTTGAYRPAAAAEVPVGARAPAACFVTLKKHGALRGCIGNIFARKPLAEAVQENTDHAARRDFRFEPVQPDELGLIQIEISVLSEPQPLPFDSPADLLAKLRPHRDGVVLQLGDRRATFLPQVWEQIPAPEKFLNGLAEKAGGAPGDWRQPDTAVWTYEVEAFAEERG